MVAFKTKKEAMKFASKRKAGFKKLMMKKPSRKVFLKSAIKSVKIRKAKRKHWKNPLYFVEGM